MFSKHLQEASPHYKDKPFGNLSLVFLGDFKQLPPACYSPLFKANAVNPSGYNLYQLFDKATTFTELVRQQGADQAECRAQLTSLGEGVFTEEDYELEVVETSTCFPQHIMQSSWTIPACAKKMYIIVMIKHSIAKMKANRQQISPHCNRVQLYCGKK